MLQPLRIAITRRWLKHNEMINYSWKGYSSRNTEHAIADAVMNHDIMIQQEIHGFAIYVHIISVKCSLPLKELIPN